LKATIPCGHATEYQRHLRTGVVINANAGRIATSGKHLRQDAGGGICVAIFGHNERHDFYNGQLAPLPLAPKGENQRT